MRGQVFFSRHIIVSAWNNLTPHIRLSLDNTIVQVVHFLSEFSFEFFVKLLFRVLFGMTDACHVLFVKL